MTGLNRVPNHDNGGYSVGGFISNLIPGKVYAMYYPNTQNYVKIEILSHTSGSSVTLRYTINVTGERF